MTLSTERGALHGQGHVRNPSHQTVERLQRLHAQLTTKAGRSVAR